MAIYQFRSIQVWHNCYSHFNQSIKQAFKRNISYFSKIHIYNKHLVGIQSRRQKERKMGNKQTMVKKLNRYCYGYIYCLRGHTWTIKMC